MRKAIVLLVLLTAGPSTAHAQSVASLFTQLPADFAHLATVSNGIILGSAGAISGGVHAKDTAVVTAARSWRFEEFFDAGDIAGRGGTQAGAALGIYIAGRIAHADRASQYGADLFRAQIVSGVMTDGLKLVANRTRPNGGRYSFPSGHASSAFATAAVTYRHFGWKAGIPAFALAGYIANSRMTEGKHFPSDLIFGAGIGIAAGRAVSFDHGKVHVSPVASRSSVGLVATF